jgi:ABC-type transport system involved in multi-copper enzyme maturation permease subunit
LAAGTVDNTILYAVVGLAVVFGLSTIALVMRGRMNLNGVWGILSFTYREAIRTKWLITFGIIFFLLAVDIPDLYLAVVRALPPEYLPSTLGQLISFSLPFVPLLALPVGAVTIVDERESGTLQYLLSNPITKAEFFLGRSVGLLLATTSVIVFGFGGAAVVVLAENLAAYYQIMLVMGVAGLLNAVMLGLALIISEFSKRKATAMGVGIMVWFLFAVVSSIDQLLIAINLKIGATAAFIVVMLDPINSAELLTLFDIPANVKTEPLTNSALVVLHVMNQNVTLAFEYTFLSICIWIAVPFVAGFLIFRHQDAA